MTSLEQYIRQAALQRGIDPDIAVRVAKSEGGLNDPTQQSLYKKNGVREPSYGPFQLLVGGEGTGFPTGLGNSALAAGIDPRDPSQVYKGIDFALDSARKSGWSPWYGAKRAGISNFAGIGSHSAAEPVTTAVADGRKGNETYAPMMGSMMAAVPTQNNMPAERPVINAGGGEYAAAPADIPDAVSKVAGGNTPRGIADIFSLLALQGTQQPTPQVQQVQGPSPEQAQALLNALRSLNRRQV